MKKRLGLLDILLLSAVLLCIGGVVLRGQMLKGSARTEEELLLTVKATLSGERAGQALAVGESLYTASGEVFGEIRKVQLRPSELCLFANGDRYTGTYPMEERCEVILTVSALGRLTENGALCKGTRCAIGATLPALYTKHTMLLPSLYKIEPATPHSDLF